jgi:HlyD family secretion protein
MIPKVLIMRNSYAILPRLLALLSILLVSGCNQRQSAQTSISIETALDRVTVGPPVKKTLQLFTEQPGRVEAFEEAPILSKLAGYVDAVHFDMGDKVNKGDLLIRIHAPEYKDQLEQKRGLLGQAVAGVAQAQAELEAAGAAINSCKFLVAQAKAGVERTEADCARWSSELARIEQLVSNGTVTSKLADETTSKLQAAEAARKESQASIDSAKAKQQEAEAGMQTAAAKVETAKAKLRVAESDVAQAETMLTYTELRAPFDGYVASRQVDVGHYVQPAGANNAQPLISIANVSKVRVCVSIPESEATWADAGFGKEGVGDSVSLLSASLPSGKIETRLTRTSPQLDTQSRSLMAEVDLMNDDRKILPGAFVTVKILLEARPDVLTLPTSAVVKTSEGTKCCTIVDGKIQHRNIELGLRVGDEVEIKAGLEGNEAVVLARAGSLQAGQPVDVIVKKP